MADKNLKIAERVTERFEVKNGLVYLWFGNTDALVMNPKKALEIGRRCIQASLDAGDKSKGSENNGN